MKTLPPGITVGALDEGNRLRTVRCDVEDVVEALVPKSHPDEADICGTVFSYQNLVGTIPGYRHLQSPFRRPVSS